VAKRRTRKQKEKARYTFIGRDEAVPINISFEPVVKGQTKKGLKRTKKEPSVSKKPKNSAKDMSFPEVKKELVKSLLLASLILGIEVMIYLAWQV
jgi:hypothetical protein